MKTVPATLRDLVDTSAAVRVTRSRSEKTARLLELFGRLRPEDLRLAALYLSGEVAQPALNVGWSAFRQAAEQARAQASADPPALHELDAAFAELGQISGPGAAARRQEVLVRLLARATPEGIEFLGGLLLGELRQGALRAQVLEAVARHYAVPVLELRRAVMFAGSFARALAALARDGPPALAAFGPQPLVPIEPMLADPAGSIEEAVAAAGTLAAEWKLDGVRVQVHRMGTEVRVFSRQLRDVTALVPELLAHAAALPAQSFIADGEAMAFDAAGRPLPFQDLMSVFSRETKASDPGDPRPVLQGLYFDLLYLGGTALVDQPYRVRRAALEGLLPEAHRVPGRTVASAEEASQVLAEALAAGHEGILLKDLDAPYTAGRRGAAWRKVKPAVTLDLVILAAEWGHGRRQGWLSNLHLGARVPGTGGEPPRFAMLGKTFKGMTDAMLREITADLLALELRREGHVVHVRPERVVEVAFDSVQRSTNHESGLALRFARVKRLRPDKRAAEADTLDTVRRFVAGGTR